MNRSPLGSGFRKVQWLYKKKFTIKSNDVVKTEADMVLKNLKDTLKKKNTKMFGHDHSDVHLFGTSVAKCYLGQARRVPEVSIHNIILA